MEARQRADAELAEEFVLVEHLLQHPAEFGLVQDGSEPAAGETELHGVVDGLANFRPSREEPLEALLQFRILLQSLALENRGRTQRQEADHRADLEPLGPAVGQLKNVVEEAVLLIPHARFTTQMRHG